MVFMNMGELSLAHESAQTDGPGEEFKPAYQIKVCHIKYLLLQTISMI